MYLLMHILTFSWKLDLGPYIKYIWGHDIQSLFAVWRVVSWVVYLYIFIGSRRCWMLPVFDLNFILPNQSTFSLQFFGTNQKTLCTLREMLFTWLPFWGSLFFFYSLSENFFFCGLTGCFSLIHLLPKNFLSLAHIISTHFKSHFTLLSYFVYHSKTYFNRERRKLN